MPSTSTVSVSLIFSLSAPVPLSLATLRKVLAVTLSPSRTRLYACHMSSAAGRRGRAGLSSRHWWCRRCTWASAQLLLVLLYACMPLPPAGAQLRALPWIWDHGQAAAGP